MSPLADIRTNLARELLLRKLEAEVAEYRNRPPHVLDVIAFTHAARFTPRRPTVTFTPWSIR